MRGSVETESDTHAKLYEISTGMRVKSRTGIPVKPRVGRSGYAFGRTRRIVVALKDSAPPRRARFAERPSVVKAHCLWEDTDDPVRYVQPVASNRVAAAQRVCHKAPAESHDLDAMSRTIQWIE